jgi:DNA-binding transcriptional ArsR family regulator
MIMAVSKVEEFGNSVQEMAEFCKSLSHPARVQLINELAVHKNRTCKELVFALPLSQATVSRHLAELLEVGLICRKLDGTQSIYTLEWNKLERFFDITQKMNTKLFTHRPKRNCC